MARDPYQCIPLMCCTGPINISARQHDLFTDVRVPLFVYLDQLSVNTRNVLRVLEFVVQVNTQKNESETSLYAMEARYSLPRMEKNHNCTFTISFKIHQVSRASDKKRYSEGLLLCKSLEMTCTQYNLSYSCDIDIKNLWLWVGNRRIPWVITHVRKLLKKCKSHKGVPQLTQKNISTAFCLPLRRVSQRILAFTFFFDL